MHPLSAGADFVVGPEPEDAAWVPGNGTAAAPARGWLIPFREVPKLSWIPVRRGGSRLAIETVHRWAVNGLRGHRLRYCCVGGVRCTSEAWLWAFFSAIGGGNDGGGNSPSGSADVPPEVGLTGMGRRRKACAPSRRAAAAARELEREGF